MGKFMTICIKIEKKQNKTSARQVFGILTEPFALIISEIHTRTKKKL